MQGQEACDRAPYVPKAFQQSESGSPGEETEVSHVAPLYQQRSGNWNDTFSFLKKKIMQCAVSVCVGGMGKSVLINYISSSVLCFRHGMLDSKSKRSSVQDKSEILFESKDDIETSR